VYPLVDIRQQALRVDATLDESLPGWFTGLTVEANIVIRKKDQALVIPRKLLLPGDTVLVQSDNGVQRTKIRKGIETLEEVEVLEGLSTASQLIIQ
jgi:HlyD family secretion protein